MKIAMVVEGRTETAFLPSLRAFLKPRLLSMPAIDPVRYDGRIPTADKLRRVVSNLLSGPRAADHAAAAGASPAVPAAVPDARGCAVHVLRSAAHLCVTTAGSGTRRNRPFMPPLGADGEADEPHPAAAPPRAIS